MNILNLVRLNEYEALMAQLEIDRNKFQEVCSKVVQAIVNITSVYGYTQRTMRTPNRPLSFKEFMVFHAKNVNFFEPIPRDLERSCTTIYVRTKIEEDLISAVDLSVKRSWIFKSNTMNTRLFLADFDKTANKIWAIDYYFGNVFSHLIPPNFEELLNQILVCRKLEAEAAQTKKEGEAK